MAHKKKHSAPVPPGNRPNVGPGSSPGGDGQEHLHEGQGAPFNEQDPKRRLGNYGTAGEHPYQQPGGRNASNHRGGE